MGTQKSSIKHKFISANLLGFGYIVAILGFFALIIGMLIIALFKTKGSGAAGIIKIIFLLVCIEIYLISTLWIKLSPPGGRELLPLEAPFLFKLINDLRKKLHVPPIYKIKITAEFNAGIVQQPHLGLLGGNHNYLIIGLPLMETCNEEQFKAILAHEFCHISKNHGRSSLWSYRMMSCWRKLSENFEGGGKNFLRFLFKPFFKKFIPYYNNISYAFQQEKEYESDSFSANCIGAEHTARTLLRIDIMDRATANYWKELDDLTQSQDLPPLDVYTGYIKYMQKTFALENIDTLLDESFARQTLEFDSHPSLTDRLKNIGYSFRDNAVYSVAGQILEFKEIYNQSAAEIYLPNDLLKTWHNELKKTWDEDYKKTWYTIREQYHADQKRLTDLVAKANTPDALTIEEHWEKAKIHDNLKQTQEAKSEYSHLIKHNYKPGSSKLLLGKLLLEENNTEGLNLIDEGLKIEPNYTYWACQKIITYYQKLKSYDQMKAWYKKLIAADEIDRLASIERQQFNALDKAELHQASEKELNDILEKLKQIPEIHRAYLIRKKVQHYPHMPMHLLAVEIKMKWFASKDYYKEFEKYLLNQTWDGTMFITVQNNDFTNKAKRIKNSCILNNK